MITAKFKQVKKTNFIGWLFCLGEALWIWLSLICSRRICFCLIFLLLSETDEIESLFFIQNVCKYYTFLYFKRSKIIYRSHYALSPSLLLYFASVFLTSYWIYRGQSSLPSVILELFHYHTNLKMSESSADTSHHTKSYQRVNCQISLYISFSFILSWIFQKFIITCIHTRQKGLTMFQ